LVVTYAQSIGACRTVDLRVTVTALDSGSDLPAGALILMEDVSGVEMADEVEGAGLSSEA
jgi:hypothetical protein